MRLVIVPARALAALGATVVFVLCLLLAGSAAAASRGESLVRLENSTMPDAQRPRPQRRNRRGARASGYI